MKETVLEETSFKRSFRFEGVEYGPTKMVGSPIFRLLQKGCEVRLQVSWSTWPDEEIWFDANLNACGRQKGKGL